MIYPNPTDMFVNISFSNIESQDIKIRLISVIGVTIFTHELKSHLGNYSKKINLENQPKGIYFLEIETSMSTINEKIILN